MLDDADLERYARQVVMPDFGEEAQQALLGSHVAVIGAGGLGAPAIQHLAAAGVGRITIVDDDEVDASNLNRQVVHTTGDIGRPKAESARDAALAINPGIGVVAAAGRFDAGAAEGMVGDARVLLDCSDNPETRHAVNTASRKLGRVMVFGGAVRVEGQLTSFDPADESSPCFACVFPETPGQDLAPRCSEAGILGPVTGTIGALMALEALRHCLKPAEPAGPDMVGRLLLFDGKAMEFTAVAVARDPGCPACSG